MSLHVSLPVSLSVSVSLSTASVALKHPLFDELAPYRSGGSNAGAPATKERSDAGAGIRDPHGGGEDNFLNSVDVGSGLDEAGPGSWEGGIKTPQSLRDSRRQAELDLYAVLRQPTMASEATEHQPQITLLTSARALPGTDVDALLASSLADSACDSVGAQRGHAMPSSEDTCAADQSRKDPADDDTAQQHGLHFLLPAAAGSDKSASDGQDVAVKVSIEAREEEETDERAEQAEVVQPDLWSSAESVSVLDVRGRSDSMQDEEARWELLHAHRLLQQEQAQILKRTVVRSSVALHKRNTLYSRKCNTLYSSFM